LANEYPGDEAYSKGYALPWINPHFPGREEGVEAVPYEYDGDWHFRAGSYSGHSAFRQHICNVLELGDFRVWISPKGPDTHGPFEEFLNFSDCEGAIGPVVSKKLAVDFVEWEERAREYALELNVKGLMSQGWPQEKAREKAEEQGLEIGGYSGGGHFWETYQNWKKAFADASNGFVAFH
jgi:hypothetical protein